MAKKDIFKVALVISLVIAAGTAYGSARISSAIPMGGGSFAPSNNVTIGVASSAAGYSANSKHLNGDRIIASVNTDPKLYYSTGASVGGSAAPPAAIDEYSALSGTSGWNSL